MFTDPQKYVVAGVVRLNDGGTGCSPLRKIVKPAPFLSADVAFSHPYVSEIEMGLQLLSIILCDDERSCHKCLSALSGLGIRHWTAHVEPKSPFCISMHAMPGADRKSSERLFNIALASPASSRSE